MNGEIEFQKKKERVDVHATDGRLTIVRGKKSAHFDVNPSERGYLLTAGEKIYDVQILHVRGDERIVRVNDHILRFIWHDDRSAFASAMNDSNGSGGLIRSMMAGRVAKIYVKPKMTVMVGDPLLVLEAMKMENDVTATCDGIVEEILVAEGTPVDPGTLLIRIHPEKKEL